MKKKCLDCLNSHDHKHKCRPVHCRSIDKNVICGETGTLCASNTHENHLPRPISSILSGPKATTLG